MSAADLLLRLQRLDVAVVLDGDRLRLSGPRDVLTPELHRELRQRRDELVALLQKVGAPATCGAGSLVPLQAMRGDVRRAPLFAVPGHNGDVFCFRPLSQEMGPEQPFLAFQPPGVDGRDPPLETVEALAARFVAEVRATEPEGPYRIGGYCTGGIVAFEAAQQLLAAGAQVAALLLFGTPSAEGYALSHRLQATPVRAVSRALRLARGDHGRPPEAPPTEPEAADAARAEHRVRVERATTRAVRTYEPTVYPGRVVLFVPSDDRRAMFCERYMEWRQVAGGGLTVHTGPSGTLHSRMLRPPAVADVAAVLRAELDRSGG
ncbi:MAG: thioesterase domain-containing protein [Planctomycetota bacterium]